MSQDKRDFQKDAQASITKEPVTILLLGSAESGKSTILKQMKVKKIEILIDQTCAEKSLTLVMHVLSVLRF